MRWVVAEEGARLGWAGVGWWRMGLARRRRREERLKHGRSLGWYWSTIKWSAVVVPDGEP